MLLAVGMILPFFTGQIKEIGAMLLPMHLPVLLCGLICGWRYGAAVGFILPLLRSISFGMPTLYPSATAMAFELMTYGLLAGALYSRFRRKTLWAVYGSLLPSLIAGRLIWGVAQTVLLGMSGKGFTLTAFWTGGILHALPGIFLQLTLIPLLMLIINTIPNKSKTNAIPDTPEGA